MESGPRSQYSAKFVCFPGVLFSPRVMAVNLLEYLKGVFCPVSGQGRSVSREENIRIW